MQCSQLQRRTSVCKRANLSRRPFLRVRCDDNKNKNQNKADFSALLSLKVNEYFSQRHKKLDELNRQYKRELEEWKLLQLKNQTVFKPPPALQAAEFKDELDSATKHLQSPLTQTFIVFPQELRQFLRAVLMLPVTLIASLNRNWQALFASPSYKNFLLSEGERIWYWRNRTENERWFWESYSWDKIFFPALFWWLYEKMVPDNIFMAVLLPLCLLYYQNGTVPGPFTVEFWWIGYFGLYQKCLPDVLWVLHAVTSW